MIWSVLLLTTTLVTPTVPSGDGQPPVTIIVIPEITTTTATASPLIPSETAVLTLRPTQTTASLQQVEKHVSQPVRRPWLWGVALAVWLWFVLGLLRPRGRRTPERTAWMMPGPPTGGLVLALRYYRPISDRCEGKSHPVQHLPEQPAGVSHPTLVTYEAVEFRSESGSSEVQPRTLGKFGTQEAAINTARIAWSSFVRDSRTDAFCVVWNHQLKRAVWISPRRARGGSVIDLRTRRPEPSSAESTKTSRVGTQARGVR